MKLQSFIIGFILINISLESMSQSLDTLTVLPYESSIVWKGKKVTGSHYGQVFIKEGILTIDEAKTIAGELIVDMNTIRVQDLTSRKMNAKLLSHLKSEDFFHVAQYPEARFNFKNATTASNENVEGTMEIKGTSNAISIPAEISFRNDTLIAKTAFEFDRTRWNIRYGSGNFFSNLGNSMIDDQVSLEITIKAIRR